MMFQYYKNNMSSNHSLVIPLLPHYHQSSSISQFNLNENHLLTFINFSLSCSLLLMLLLLLVLLLLFLLLCESMQILPTFSIRIQHLDNTTPLTTKTTAFFIQKHTYVYRKRYRCHHESLLKCRREISKRMYKIIEEANKKKQETTVRIKSIW